jgi:hypothetical protein
LGIVQIFLIVSKLIMDLIFKPTINHIADHANTALPLDTPVIAYFSYLSDCHVKVPVSIRQKDGEFFMKNPVKPNPAWKFNLVIRSIDFPYGHPIKLSRSPFGDIDIWESQILQKAAHSEFAEVYQITEPKYFQIATARRSTRIFCLTPVSCFVGEGGSPVNATCIDMSEDGLGMGLRFESSSNVQIGDKCRINFLPPYENLPEISGKIVRQSTSALDKSTSAGLVLSQESAPLAQKIIQFISERQATQNSDSFTHSPSPIIAEKGRSLLSNLTDSFPRDFLSILPGGSGFNQK